MLTEALAASGDEAKRAFDAMMGMKKIDVAAIKAARLRCVAGRWFAGLERRLEGRGWIACADFTALTFFFATVVREVRKTDLTDAYPRLKAYYARGLTAPGLAAHPQPPLRAARRDRSGPSLRLGPPHRAPARLGRLMALLRSVRTHRRGPHSGV